MALEFYSDKSKRRDFLVSLGLTQDQVKALEDEYCLIPNTFFNEHITVIWCVDDIIHLAKSLGKVVSRDRAVEILQEIEHRHDASIGINWDVISYYL